jgi:hypothetical protein
MALTEAEKDAVADIVHSLREKYETGDPEMWKGGEPEKRFAAAIASLGPEKTRFAESLLEQDAVRLNERPDPVLTRIDEQMDREGGNS